MRAGKKVEKCSGPIDEKGHFGTHGPDMIRRVCGRETPGGELCAHCPRRQTLPPLPTPGYESSEPLS